MAVSGRLRRTLRIPAGPLASRRDLSRVPLRTKLVAAMLCLVVAALATISISSTFVLRPYLISRVDEQLQSIMDVSIEAAARVDYSKMIRPPDVFAATTDAGGHGRPPVYDNDLTAVDLPHILSGDDIAKHAGKTFTTHSDNGTPWRMLVGVLPNGVVLQLAARIDWVDRLIARLLWSDLVLGAAALIALAAVGAELVRRSLDPLIQIERTAGAIAAGDLTRRVPDPEPGGGAPQTELGRLARALNIMLAEIEAAFIARAQSEAAAREAAYAAQLSEGRAVRSEAKMRQFVADASHELRTPLTTIRGFAELYRQGAVSRAEDVSALVRRIEDEAARMGLLVEDLLLLARLDRERPLELGPVELPVLAMDAVAAAEATAPQRAVRLEISDDPERLVAYGDDARLRQVIGNLVTNALVHTPPDARVTVRVYAQDGDRAVVEVADTGPGLTAEQRAHVFERFYRADHARTRNTDSAATGTGLGLAIVAAIVRAHQGSVDVHSEPGQGSAFRVTLPTVRPEPGFSENIQA